MKRSAGWVMRGIGLWVAILALACGMGIRPAVAAPMFPDVPDNWAAEAVRALAGRGMLEGYPDGTFKGDRAATRYEAAMVIARFLARMEQDHAMFLTRAELDEVMKLARSYAAELDALGVKTQDLEERYARLDKRVGELERITFYGNFRANGTFQSTAGARSGIIGTLGDPAIDFTNGRLIFNGTGMTSRAMLGTQLRLNEDMDAGMEFIAFTAAGESDIEQYWGVTPPYHSNPFLAQNSILPFVQPASNSPFTRMSLDRFWLQDRAHNYQLILGTYALKVIGDNVLLGIRNPNVHAPAILPFWGFDVTPLQGSDKVQYEFAFSKLPNGGLYYTWLGATGARYDFGPVKFGLSLARMVNEPVTDGQPVGTGSVILPTANGTPLSWVDSRTGALRRFVGPQDESIWGADVSATIIDKKLFFRGNYAHSSYNPDKSKQVLDAHPGGSQFSAGLQAVLGQFRPEFEYVYADPTYDTMMLPYNTNPAFPIFLPYGNWYSSHYQLHDYLKYPDNRRGPRVTLGWVNNATRLFFSYEDLQQVKATTLAQIKTPGSVEPLFPVIVTPGVAALGTTRTMGIGGGHQFGAGYRVAGSFYDYKLRRSAVAVDDVDFAQRFYRVEVGKALSDELDFSLHYSLLDFTGHTGLTNRSFEQSIPAATLTWTPARNASVSLEGRLLTFRDRLNSLNNWHGNQVLVDFNIDF